MLGKLFLTRENGKFYYSPLTNRLVNVPPSITLEQLADEPGLFRFEYDRQEVSQKLQTGLDTLILESTQNCNLRCNYCIYSGAYLGERKHQNIDMSQETAKNSGEYFIKHSNDTKPLRVISFYGGEPLMNFDCIDTLVKTFARTPRLKFSISTNGILLDRYRNFIQENNIMVAVSLDGDKLVHDSQRRFYNGEGSFDRVNHNLSLFDPKYVKTRFSFSATLTDKSQLVSVYDFFRKNYPHNAFRIGFQKVNDLKHPRGIILPDIKDFNFLGEEYRQAIANGKVPAFLKFFFDNSMSRIFRRGRKYGGIPLKPRGYCVPGTRKLFVKPDGSFYTCEKLGYSAFKIGDVSKGIDTEKVYSMMDETNTISEKHCSECWATLLCDSCLRYDLCKEGQSDEERLKENCETKRRSIEMYLGLYVDLYTSLGNKFIEYLNKIDL